MKTKKEEIELGIKSFEDLSINDLRCLRNELYSDNPFKNADYIDLINKRIRDLFDSIRQIEVDDIKQKVLVSKFGLIVLALGCVALALCAFILLNK